MADQMNAGRVPNDSQAAAECVAKRDAFAAQHGPFWTWPGTPWFMAASDSVGGKILTGLVPLGATCDPERECAAQDCGVT